MHLHYHGPFLKLKMKTFLSIGLYFTISVVLIPVRGVFAAHRSRKEYLFLGVLGRTRVCYGSVTASYWLHSRNKYYFANGRGH